MGLRLLDTFCGAGGAARGYVSAGFEVTGVDIVPQPRYLASGASRFIQANALDFIAAKGGEYDIIHASPPCQAYSPLRFAVPAWKSDPSIYPDLIPSLRALLISTRLPWIIENVPTAPLAGSAFSPFGNPVDLALGLKDLDESTKSVVLCGSMFGLRTYRHRRFESSLRLDQPRHPRHSVKSSTRKRQSDWEAGDNICVTGDVGRRVASLALGIGWMTGLELSQAIPPAYTRYLGLQLHRLLRDASGASGAPGKSGEEERR